MSVTPCTPAVSPRLPDCKCTPEQDVKAMLSEVSTRDICRIPKGWDTSQCEEPPGLTDYDTCQNGKLVPWMFRSNAKPQLTLPMGV